MANGYKVFDPFAFSRELNTTLAQHIRDVEPAMGRAFQLGALLEGAARISKNNRGAGFDWPVQYRFHEVEGNTGETPRNFVRRNLFKTAYLEYRGYQATDSMYYREFRANRGREAIIRVFDSFTERLEASLKHALGTQYYLDGSAAGNEEMWHGLETIFQATQTVDITSTTTIAARTANAGDRVMYPTGTYAGLSMQLANYGGDNESGSVWPDGIADSQADFWTPLIVAYDSTALGGSADTFRQQGDEAIRYALLSAQRNSSKDGQITNVILSRDLYFDFLNLMSETERTIVSKGDDPMSLTRFGFKNVIGFDGIEVSWEAGVPASVGYGLNYNCIDLKCMDDDMYRVEGPVYDIHSQSFNAVVSTLSNLKFKSPRNFFKLIQAT